jgi:hypothetical protein
MRGGKRCFHGVGASVGSTHNFFKRAIRIIMPAPQRADDFSFALLKGSAASGKTNLFDAIVALNGFERFFYVMSVLERQSDDDCSALLGCARRDVIIARELALERLAKTRNPYDQPIEAVGLGEQWSRIITPDLQVIFREDKWSVSITS